jgi:hypothetical protein
MRPSPDVYLQEISMPHDNRKRTQIQDFLLFLLRLILPRAVREEYLSTLSELAPAAGNLPRRSMNMVLGAYKNQILLAVDSVSIAAHIGGMAYCFSAAGMPGALAIVLGSVLVPLILRTAHAHLWDINGNRWTPTSPWQYSMDSMLDALITMAVVLMCQTLSIMFEPEVAMKTDPLFRGIALGLPLFASMRMAMRPRANWEHMPFQNSNLTAEQIFKRTWLINILWIATCQFIIMTNAKYLPDWIPDHDFLKTFIPMKIFVNWFHVQQNSLIRRDKIETVFGPHWRKKQLARQREILMKGLKKGEPHYAWYIGLQGLLFLYLSIPLARALWPWLAGTASSRDVYDVLFNVVALITLVWTWSYLKEANRAAADAMQQEIDSLDLPICPEWWPRIHKFVTWCRRVADTACARRPRLQPASSLGLYLTAHAEAADSTREGPID